jgi:hypothetical protein
MVNLGGYNLNLFNWGKIGGMLQGILIGILVLFVVGVLIWYFWGKVKTKTSFNNKIRLTMIMENGTRKTRNDIRGGKFINKSGTWDFQCKIPKQFKKKELGFMPDFSLAEADGTLHFVTSGDATLWQQVRDEFQIEQYEYTDKYGVKQKVNRIKNIMTPVPNQDKQAVINSIKSWRELVDKQKLTAFGIAIGAFIIMVIAHLISLYIQTKVKCPVPTPVG